MKDYIMFILLSIFMIALANSIGIKENNNLIINNQKIIIKLLKENNANDTQTNPR